MLTEDEFRTELAKWLYTNKTTAYYSCPGSFEAYLLNFKLPDFDYEHTQSFCDLNGDLITLLKAEIHIHAIQSRKRKDSDFVFYKVLRTFTEVPYIEPDTAGYFISHIL